MVDGGVGTRRPAQGCRPGTACVLFVEDHRDTRVVMSRLLASEGFGVLTAATVADAKQILATEPVDVLVCDVELPDGDGCARGARRRGRAVAVSGHAGAEHEDRCRAAGFAAYLVKPVRWEDLRAAVLAAAAGRRRIGLIASACPRGLEFRGRGGVNFELQGRGTERGDGARRRGSGGRSSLSIPAHF